jgi:hypothetical protein
MSSQFGTATRCAVVLLTTVSFAASTQAQPMSLQAAPGWDNAMPSGPDTRVKITEAYARLVARDIYFWAWPLVNVYSRRLAFANVPDIVMSGPVPAAPPNRLGMLTDYIEPQERLVACPNQDVVYGVGVLALDLSPVVIQVPDFGNRFWVYQLVDLRTDSFVQLGKMYATTPGFYMLVGPDWHGEVPKGITKVFRSSTNTGFVAPRVFQDDTPEDKRAVQNVLQQVLMYPVSEYDGTMKSRDWSKLQKIPSQSEGNEEVKWVVPEKFFDELPAVLADAPPMPGEEMRYAQVIAVLDAMKSDRNLKQAMIAAATEADKEIVPRCFNFAIMVSSYRTIGAQSRTRRHLAVTTSREQRSRSRTFSSTHRTKRNITIRTSTRLARGSMALTTTPLPSRRIRHRRSMASGHSRFITNITSSTPMTSNATRSAPRTKT